MKHAIVLAYLAAIALAAPAAAPKPIFGFDFGHSTDVSDSNESDNSDGLTFRIGTIIPHILGSHSHSSTDESDAADPVNTPAAAPADDTDADAPTDGSASTESAPAGSDPSTQTGAPADSVEPFDTTDSTE